MSILMLDEIRKGNSWGNVFRREFGCRVDLSETIKSALENLGQRDYYLLIIEPFIFGEVHEGEESPLLPVFREARKKDARLMVVSSLAQNDIRSDYGFTDYDSYHRKPLLADEYVPAVRKALRGE